MIDLALIEPIGIAKELGHESRMYHMALAHLVLEDEEYRNWYRYLSDLGRYVILDNSLMERSHTAMSMAEVWEAAQLIRASEVVLPDAFRDAQGTIAATTQAIQWLETHAPVEDRFCRFAGVVHGKTVESWFECYAFMHWQTLITTIHIPKVMDTLWPYGGRAGLLRTLDHDFLGKRSSKDHHLLGIWTDPLELYQIHDMHWIRSCDTALPVQAAVQGVRFDPWQGIPQGHKKPKRPDDYFATKADGETLELCRYNIEVLDMWAMGDIHI